MTTDPRISHAFAAEKGGVVRYTITHQGAPIGTAGLDASAERTVGQVNPLPACAAVRPLVQTATDALSGVTAGLGDAATGHRR